MLSIEEKILTLNSLRLLPVAALRFTLFTGARCLLVTETNWFLPERDYVMFGSLLSQFRLSSVCLSYVVCHVGAPYLGGWTFPQYFFSAVYAGHPLTSVQNFTEIVLGNHSFIRDPAFIGDPAFNWDRALIQGFTVYNLIWYFEAQASVSGASNR